MIELNWQMQDEESDMPPPAPTAEQILAAREASLAEVDVLLIELRERVCYFPFPPFPSP